MLKTRVIPTLLMKDTTLVKGVGFDSWRRVGTTLPAIRVYNRRQVDELIVLDISATPSNRPIDLFEVREFAPDCFVPLTVGGGIKNIETIKNLLRAGADKVALNSITYSNPDIVSEASERFGVQCIVVSIDAKKEADGSYQCYSSCGSKAEGKNPADWAKFMEEKGAGEILITSIEKDGAMEGYDIKLIKMISDAVSIPVIASGGAGNLEDTYEAIEKGGAQAISAASIFHFTEITPLEVKDHLKSKGINVRNSNKA